MSSVSDDSTLEMPDELSKDKSESFVEFPWLLSWLPRWHPIKRTCSRVGLPESLDKSSVDIVWKYLNDDILT